MVGAARFELATSCTPSKRASQATLRPDRICSSEDERRGISRSFVPTSTNFSVAGDPPVARYKREVAPGSTGIVAIPFCFLALRSTALQPFGRFAKAKSSQS